MNDKNDYSAQEAQKRFEAALRGSRAVGHKQMKDISPKRGRSEPRPRPASSKKSQNRGDRPKAVR